MLNLNLNPNPNFKRSRYRILQRILLLFSMLIALQHSLVAQQRRPNIVLIVADDLGLGDLGSYGQKHIKTPHLDKLAHEGQRYTQFYAGTSVCAPSRASLLSGMHTGHTYIRGNKELEPEGQEPLADSISTLAMDLQAAGYVTGAFGKWGLGMVGSSGDPNRKGFHTFYGYNCQRQSHRYYPTHLWHNAQRIALEGNDLSHQLQYAPTLIQAQTLKFIDDNKDQPFFLFVPTVLPHAELAGPTDEFYALYEDAFSETPHKGEDYGPEATVAGYASVAKPRATYAAMVSRMDHYVGEIVAKLEDLGLRENTIIIFSSDNGAHQEGGADAQFFNSTADLKGLKRSLYEGGIRVPLLLSWPGTIPVQQQNKHIAAFWDLRATVRELSHSPVNNAIDGISFLPAILEKGTQQQHDFLYWEFHEDGGRQALRAKNWKLIKQQAKDPAKSYYELFDLSTDPQEKNNRAAGEPQVLKKLIKKMEQARTESPIFPFLGPTKK